MLRAPTLRADEAIPPSTPLAKDVGVHWTPDTQPNKHGSWRGLFVDHGHLREGLMGICPVTHECNVSTAVPALGPRDELQWSATRRVDKRRSHAISLA